MSKMNALQDALKQSSGRSVQSPAPMGGREEQQRPARPAERREPAGSARAGKENIAAWLPPGFKKSIRLVQAKLPSDPTLQDLMAEALNDLFVKYNVPTVSLPTDSEQ